MLKCPSKECGKIYSFIKCSKCHKLIFSQENEIIGPNYKFGYSEHIKLAKKIINFSKLQLELIQN